MLGAATDCSAAVAMTLLITAARAGRIEPAISTQQQLSCLRIDLGGHFKTGHRWTPENRPLGEASETGESISNMKWIEVRGKRDVHLVA